MLIPQLKSAEYEKKIEELLMSFRQQQTRMSVKVHFLRSLVDYFPNCRHLYEEQGMRFHRDIRIMEEHY